MGGLTRVLVVALADNAGGCGVHDPLLELVAQHHRHVRLRLELVGRCWSAGHHHAMRAREILHTGLYTGMSKHNEGGVQV